MRCTAAGGVQSPAAFTAGDRRMGRNARVTEKERKNFGFLENFHLGARLHNAAKRMCDQLKKNIL